MIPLALRPAALAALSAPAFLPVLALPARAEGGATEAEIAAFVAAAEALGCTVTPANLPDLLQRSGLAEDRAAGVVAPLLHDRRAEELPDGGLRLHTGGCA